MIQPVLQHQKRQLPLQQPVADQPLLQHQQPPTLQHRQLNLQLKHRLRQIPKILTQELLLQHKELLRLNRLHLHLHLRHRQHLLIKRRPQQRLHLLLQNLMVELNLL
jgi:hypothetical protein